MAVAGARVLCLSRRCPLCWLPAYWRGITAVLRAVGAACRWLIWAMLCRKKRVV